MPEFFDFIIGRTLGKLLLLAIVLIPIAALLGYLGILPLGRKRKPEVEIDETAR